VYGLSIGDKSGDLGLPLAYFFGEHFSTRDISHTFRSAMKFDSVRGLANGHLLPESGELWPSFPGDKILTADIVHL